MGWLNTLALVATSAAWVLLGIQPSTRQPSAVESFNAMAAESFRSRSKLEWALRIGVIIGTLAALFIVMDVKAYGEIQPPADLIYPLLALGGAACALPLRFRFGVR